MQNYEKKCTSSDQFDVMLNFMEKHGDISNPTENLTGRLLNARKWDQLAALLNSQNGARKTTNKWRKVWSDFKNNTKRKAMRMNSRGPFTKLKFSPIEKRTIKFICSNRVKALDNSHVRKRSPSVNTSGEEESTNPLDESANPLEESAIPLEESSNLLKESINQLENYNNSADTTQTLHRVIIRKLNDCEKERIRLETERLRLESERLRLKDIELRQQAQWQDMFRQFMTIINKYVDKNVYD